MMRLRRRAIATGNSNVRVIITIAIAILSFGFGHEPVLAQSQTGGVPALDSIQMIDATTGWAVSPTDGPGRGVLLRTSDAGTHWTDVTPPGSMGRMIPDGPYSLDVLTSLIAWVGPFRTIDGGLTWRNGAVPPGGRELMHFINPHDGWLVSVTETGANMASAMLTMDIYRTTDAGDTWIKLASTSAGKQGGLSIEGLDGPKDMTFLNETTGWLTGNSGVEDSLYLYVTHDGGRTWQHQTAPLPVKSTWYGVISAPRFFTTQDGILPVVGRFAIFYITHDGGTTWAYTTPVTVHSEPALSFADMDHGWMTDGIGLYVTSDGGRHWTIEPPPSAGVKQLDFISLQVGWAVSRINPFLLKTVDGGHTWVPVPYTVSRH